MTSTLKLALLVLCGLVAVKADWQLIWSDEFDGAAGSSPDGSKWGYDIGGGGWGNNELEYYTSSTNNAALDGNSNLLITARTDDAWQYSCWYGTCQYTSARMLTSGKFETTYGRIEARIKVPYGKGVWPAFWMLGNDINSSGWPNCGEIDIMEMHGSDPTYILGTIHGPGYSGAGGLSGNYYSPDGHWFSDDYHVYSVEWYSDSVNWYVDGNWYETRTPSDTNGNPWVFTHPFFIIFDFAVGGNFDGDPDGSAPFPQSMTVDYVRVYQQV